MNSPIAAELLHPLHALQPLPEPYDLVKQYYDLPFPLYDFQGEAVNDLAPLPRSALYHEPGLGKTISSTVCSLYKRIMGESEITLVLMPPILDATWRRWLAKVKRSDGTPVTVLSYRGTPAQRKAMRFNTDFVLMSVQIFKRDYERIERELGSRRVHVILDEATSVKNISSDNHKLYRSFVADQTHQLLTGTPLSTPEDAYAYCKLIAPSMYRNLAQFLRIHAMERDFFNKVTVWGNLDLLAENMRVNASFVKKEEVLLELPPKVITPVEYELDPGHLKLYRTLVEDQLLKLPDGQKVDATTAGALYHALGQLVMSWDHFSGDPSKVARGFEVIEETLEELGHGKLVVFANYRMTNRAIVRRFEKYGAVGVWGDVPSAQKERNIARFCEDDTCRLITLQPSSAGYGIDGLQEVSADCLFVEPPSLARHYDQALSRLYRDGQRKSVNVRIATAQGTLQVRALRNLVENEALVNPLQGSKVELRAALLGE